MKPNHTTETTGQAPLPAAQSGLRATIRSRISLLGCAAAALLLAAAGSAMAQTTNIVDEYTTNSTTAAAAVTTMTLESLTGDKGRLTVAVNETGNSVTEVKFTMGPRQTTLVSSVTNFIDPDYYITNYYEISPAVVTLAATGVPATGGGSGVVFSGGQSFTNFGTGNVSVTNTVTLNYTNLASGDYNMAVEAVGANTWRYPLPVKAGFRWSAGGGANTNFNNVANWVGGVVPGASDIVILADAGTNTIATNATITVASDTTVSSVSDIHTANYTHWKIETGATLSILGDDGYRQLVDIIDGNGGMRSPTRASGEGTMLVSNANAQFFGLVNTAVANNDSLNFSNLNTLVLDVKNIAFNDILAYPNYGTNGTANRPSGIVYDIFWAKTNILRTTLTDVNDWTNNTRQYGLVINRPYGQTGNDGGMHFGLWNELYMDSILFGGNSQMESPEVDFRASDSYLLMRASDKVSRVSNLTIADAMNPVNASQANGGATKIDVVFSRGRVDALVDTLIIARNPRNTANGPATGKLYLGAAAGNTTFDVNNAYIGYQTGPCDGTENGFAAGQLYVQSNTVFRVNGTMVLGYTETNTSTVVGGYGRLEVTTASGVAQVNNLTVGGPANASTGGNNVTVGSGATLVISNGMGSLSAPVFNLSIAGTLVLPNLTSTTQTNVYAANISGSGGVISLPGITAGGTYVVAKYTSSALPTWTLSLPSGYYGFLVVDTGDQTIKAVVSSSPPKTCVWVGYPGTDWDTTSLNWKELTSGNPTNFAQGDAVLFDDSASNATVNVALVVYPAGGTTITNDTLNYTFGGSDIDGTAGTTKTGTGTVTYDNIHKPSLTVGTNSSLVVNGQLRGGLTHRGISAINNGTILGSVSLNNSNAFLVNNGTITTTPGALTLVAGTILTNSSSGTINNGSGSTTTTPLGSLVVNQGQINNITARIEVNGVWISDGGTVTDLGATSEALLAAGAGRFGIQTTGELYIRGTGNINSSAVQARFDNQAGSRVYIDVDRAASPNCDSVLVDYFGNMLGTFVMNNVGATPFANGDSFIVMNQTYSIPKTNATPANVPKVSPAAAGVGLQWDVTNMRANYPGTTNPPAASATRTIAVVVAPTSPLPVMTTSNYLGNLYMTWSVTNISYQLKVQTNDLNTGLSTNWAPVAGSENTNKWVIPIVSTNPAVFYRLSNQ